MSNGRNPKTFHEFEWAIGAERNGTVRIGRNTFIESAMDENGLPWNSVEEIKALAAKVIAAKRERGLRKKGLTDRGKPA